MDHSEHQSSSSRPDDLASDADDLDIRLDAVVEEYLSLRRAGRAESIEEFASRHPALRRELMDVLPALDGIEGLKSATDSPVRNTAYLGAFRLLGEIGRGGMGIVYEAVEEALGRQVALKVLPRQACLDARLRDRFRREAQAAGKLHHTNIVPVFGFHEHDDVYFYTMQRIDGVGLDRLLEACRRRRAGSPDIPAELDRLLDSPVDPEAPGDPRLSSGPGSSSAGHGVHSPYFRDVALLGLQVAEALDYAHRRGVLHRDIKPSNILVDPTGNAWITDFGLAKIEDDDGLTHTGELVGTCRYMAPEAFESRASLQSDVYGLGATLYEAAALRPAFDDSNRSRLIASIAGSPPQAPRRIDRRIPRDLETIIVKALEKRPADRYASASALADDLRRFLSGIPPRARIASAPERLWRWCRRSPALAGSLFAIIALLAVVAAISSVAWVETRASLREAHLNAGKLARSGTSPGRRWMALDALGRAASIAPSLALRNEAIAAAHLVDLRRSSARDDLELGHSTRMDADLRRIAYVDRNTDSAVVRSTADGRVLLRDATFERLDRVEIGPDGSLLALVSYGGLRVRDVDSSAVLLDRREPVNLAKTSMAAGKRVSYCSKRTLVIVDLKRDEEIRLDVSERAPWAKGTPFPLLSPDGSRMAVVFHNSRDVGVFDASLETVVRLRNSVPVQRAWWDPHRPLLVTGGFIGQNSSRVSVWDLERGSLIQSFDDPKFVHTSFSVPPQRDLLISATWGSTLSLRDLRTGDVVVRGDGYPAFTARDGKRLAAVEGARLVTYDLQLPECHHVLREPGRPGNVFSSSFHPALPILATSYQGGTLWDPRSGRVLARLAGPKLWLASFLPDGSKLVGCGDKVVTWPVEWTRREGQIDVRIGPARTLREGEYRHARLSPDGAALYALKPRGAGFEIHAVHTGSGEVVRSWGPYPRLSRLDASPDGRWLAAGASTLGDRTVRIFDLHSGHESSLQVFSRDPAPRFGPDSRTLLVGGFSGYSFFEVGTWKLLREVHVTRGEAGAFSPDGSLAACRSDDTAVLILDAATGEEVATLTPDDIDGSSEPEFSPDGALLSAGTRVWDLRRLRKILTELGLDWARPPYPSPPDEYGEAVSVRVVVEKG